MERDFQSMLVEAEGSGPLSSALSFSKNTENSSVNAMYSGMNSVQPLFPSLDYAFGTLSVGFPPIPTSDPVTFGFFSENFQAIQTKQFAECSTKSDQILKSIDLVGERLKMPKQEPFSNEEIHISTKPFNFISKTSDPISNLYNSSFLQLPELCSLEQVSDDFAFSESSRKRIKSFSSSDDPYALESILRNFKLSSYYGKHKSSEIQTPPVGPQNSVARQRRQRISEKTRCLQKLLPWDKKMDMATMLEEAYKYIKFLQAQIVVLQSMPSDSSCFATQNPSNVNVFGRLGRLNRQQLLQVLVNSPVAQTILYSQGSCVYSIEQLVLLKNIAERKVLYQQMLFDPSMLS